MFLHLEDFRKKEIRNQRHLDQNKANKSLTKYKYLFLQLLAM